MCRPAEIREKSVERTINYEGVPWRVRVNPVSAGRESESGLELVFMERGEARHVTAPVSQALLESLTRDGLDIEEATLRAELREALRRQRNEQPNGEV